MRKKPLLSIVIPTKNREIYAYNAIKHILSVENQNIEIIIEDNSTNTSLHSMLSDLKKDERLVYNYNSKKISHIENFNNAINCATGEYICIIGDDDGLNPDIMKIVQWAYDNNIDAIKPGLQAAYFWPESGVQINPDLDDNGILSISNITLNYHFSNPKKELYKLLKEGCQNYYEKDLVKIYHGIVRRKYMEKIKDITGNYFGGLSPDIYSVVALSSMIDKCLNIDYPLTIAGVCKVSTSADSSTGRHTGRLEDAPHFNGRDGYVWAPEVPKFYSVFTIWADSALASVRDLKDKELLKAFSLSDSSGRLLLRFFQFKKEILNHYFAQNKNKLIPLFRLIYAIARTTVKYTVIRLKRKLSKSSNTTIYFDELVTIGEAEKKMMNYIDSKGYGIDKLIEVLNNKK